MGRDSHTEQTENGFSVQQDRSKKTVTVPDYPLTTEATVVDASVLKSIRPTRSASARATDRTPASCAYDLDPRAPPHCLMNSTKPRTSL